MIPIGLLSLYQIKTPWSSCIGVALISSSLSFKYQYLLASQDHKHIFLSSHTLSVLASFGGRTNTARSIGFPCRKAVLTFSEFISPLFDEIKQKVRRRPSLQQVGLSVQKHCSSSKPGALNLALIIFLSSKIFSLSNHRKNTQPCPWFVCSV